MEGGKVVYSGKLQVGKIVVGKRSGISWTFFVLSGSDLEELATWNNFFLLILLGVDHGGQPPRGAEGVSPENLGHVREVGKPDPDADQGERIAEAPAQEVRRRRPEVARRTDGFRNGNLVTTSF